MSSLVMWCGRRRRRTIGYTAAQVQKGVDRASGAGARGAGPDPPRRPSSSSRPAPNGAARPGATARAGGSLQAVFDDDDDDDEDLEGILSHQQPRFERSNSLGSDMSLLDVPLRAHRRKVQRLAERDAADYQSLGYFNVKHRGESNWVFVSDFYHVVIHMALWKIIALFWTLYLVAFFGFALFWRWVSVDCEIHIQTMLDAIYFSIETQMSIGFGAPDASFDACYPATWVLPSQSLVGVFLDVTFIGIVFAKVSTASQRALTVVFSDVALLQVVDGGVQLVFRVADTGGRPLSQAVIQVYCVQHHEDEHNEGGVRVEVAAMELQERSIESKNGVIFFGLPATVVHHVDWNSPLAPPSGPARPASPGSPGAPARPRPDRLREHLQGRPFLEVVVLVGGIEDSSASSVEARHSYTLDDMYWERTFVDCVSLDADGYHQVDNDLLHDSFPSSWAEVVRTDRRVQGASSSSAFWRPTTH